MLRACGALARLETLRLNVNKIGDSGVTALVEALAGGALAQLKTLGLYSNGIGDDGAPISAAPALWYQLTWHGNRPMDASRNKYGVVVGKCDEELQKGEDREYKRLRNRLDGIPTARRIRLDDARVGALGVPGVHATLQQRLAWQAAEH